MQLDERHQLRGFVERQDDRASATTGANADVSVVICTYTEARWDDLVACVQSVKDQTFPAAETVVIVDHNPALLERVSDLGVHAVENRYGRGLSGARNTGIESTQGALIAFLDDDAVAKTTWLEAMVQPFRAPSVLGVGGHIEPLWMAPPAPWFPREFYWVLGCTHRGMPQGPAPIRNPFGASMCIRREVFDQVGGFRTGVGRADGPPMGCEETELCIRAVQHWTDGLFMYQPGSVVQHRVPAERSRWKYFVSRCYAEGLSKAIITSTVGPRAALATERSYAMRTLPLGVLVGVGDAMRGRDRYGVMRAGAIVAGLAVTTAGYVNGRSRSYRSQH